MNKAWNLNLHKKQRKSLNLVRDLKKKKETWVVRQSNKEKWKQK